MKQLTEEDRKQKLIAKIQSEGSSADQQLGKDSISKIFDRPTHQAYDRRAKQDKVISYISDNWQLEQAGKGKDKEKLAQICENQAGFNKQFAPEKAFASQEARKQRTQEMKKMLDM